MTEILVERLRAIIKDQRGMESLEYTVFAGAFLFIILASVVGISGNLSTAYTAIGDYLTSQAASI
jgi:Flp pilus assembly pilin Flp